MLGRGITICSLRTNIVALLALASFAAGLLVIPPAAPALKVAAAGDISCSAGSTVEHVIMPGQQPAPDKARCQGRQVALMIAAQNPDVALALGDLIQGQQSHTGAFMDFNLAWGHVLGPRVLPTLGNHDYHRDREGSLSADGYFDHWAEQGAPAWKTGRRGEGWSSWDSGRWHMINLNSNCRVTDCTFTGPQLRWLIKDLKADRRNPATQCTLAYFHHPLFSAGMRAGRSGDRTLVSNLWELLYRYRADLVITGHQHYYERYLPQDPQGNPDPTGLTQIISGTGGAFTFGISDGSGVEALNSVTAIRRLGATFLNLGDGHYSTHFRDRLGRVHDPVRTKRCLRPNAGRKLRAPRSRRYAEHMEGMADLNRRIKRRNRSVRGLARKDAARFTIRKHRRTRANLIKKRNRMRSERLY